MSEKLLTTLDASKSIELTQAAKIIGLTVRTLRDYAKKGKVPGAYQPGGKWGHWKFKRSELEKWWARQGN